MLNNSQIFQRSVARGALAISCLAMPQGRDLLVILTGGESHVGGAAIASPDGQCLHMALHGHKDDLPAKIMAASLARALRRNVIVSAGIHYNNATSREIAQIMEMCDILTSEIMAFYGGLHAEYENS